MKQSLRQKNKLSLNLTSNLKEQIKLLSLSGLDIRYNLDELIAEFCKGSVDKRIVYFRDEVLTDRLGSALYSDPKPNFSELSIDHENSLRDKLMEQLVLSPLKEYETLIGEIIIDSILDNGRLDPELKYSDIKRIINEDFDLKINDQKIESVLKVIQNLDPPGCGYRSIEESLTIQVNSLGLEKVEHDKVMKSLTSLIDQKIKIEDLSSEVKIQINKLNLNQGLNFSSNKNLYIKADLIAFLQNNEWKVSLNDKFMNEGLIQAIKKEIESSKLKKVVEMKSFLQGLERRQQTLFLVGQYVITKQSQYLNKDSDKQPISNKEIARALAISESTVSRIVKNKYIQLPDKLILLKDLLQKKVNRNNEGKDITPEELKYFISLLISRENSKKPLSDENLRNLLSTQHLVNIARRTVTKYRIEAGFGSTRVRKNL